MDIEDMYRDALAKGLISIEKNRLVKATVGMETMAIWMTLDSHSVSGYALDRTMYYTAEKHEYWN